MHILFFHKNKKFCRCLRECAALFILLSLFACAHAKKETVSGVEGILTDTAAMPGWKPAGEPYHYTPPDLYNYINGAADLFIAYGFIELTGANYSPVSENMDSITVDIYDMGEKLNAIGVLQSKRDRESPSLNIGAASFGTDDYIVFCKGRYYVEIQAFITGEKHKSATRTIAGRVAEQVPGDSSLPVELSYLPEKAKVERSERYIRGGILGHAFLDRGIACDYLIGGKKISAFVAFFPSSQAAQKSLKQYVSFLQGAGKRCEPFEGIGDRGFASDEPYHKKIVVILKGAFVAGVYELSSIKEGRTLLEGILHELSSASVSVFETENNCTAGT